MNLLQILSGNWLPPAIKDSTLLKSDTLYHKIEMISKDKHTFFTTENPIWYVLTLLLSGLIAYLFSSRQKKNDSITEAKKMFLDKRIEKHNELFKIYSKAKIVTNPPSNPNSVYHKIFSSYQSMSDWYDQLLIFIAENNFFFSKSIHMQISLQNNLRKHIDYIYNSGTRNDAQIQNLAIKYNRELGILFKNLELAIANFYENEISLSYTYNPLTDAEFKEMQKQLYSYSIISDNFGKSSSII